MATDDGDDLVAFEDVRVIRATAPTLLCLIRGRSVWLPRGHISGKLWCTGDRGKLFIRRWVARDRNLMDLHGTAIDAPVRSLSPPRLPGLLHLVRGDRSPLHAK
jgi:hypothetical protein